MKGINLRWTIKPESLPELLVLSFQAQVKFFKLVSPHRHFQADPVTGISPALLEVVGVYQQHEVN